MTETFQINSYKKHKEHYKNTFNQEKLEIWQDKSNIDYWRHIQMYKYLDAFIENDKDSSWLTLGDGRYGVDANYILSKGVKNVLATDISDTLLKIAKEDAFIKDYKTENAENISCDDNTYDYVLCKESLHHFPRPMVALYEMIRVAKKTVILIEPNDKNIMSDGNIYIIPVIKWCIQGIKNGLRKLSGKKPIYAYNNYEEVGNYIYTISEREIEKIGISLNYDMVSFKRINDYFDNRISSIKANKKNKDFRRIKRKIKISDLKTRMHIQQSGMIVAILHITKPDEEILKELRSNGFKNKFLPKNPYC